jgi:hypothetical protein
MSLFDWLFGSDSPPKIRPSSYAQARICGSCGGFGSRTCGLCGGNVHVLRRIWRTMEVFRTWKWVPNMHVLRWIWRAMEV